MSRPQVIFREQDQSVRVPALPGVIGAMVIPATKGPSDKPFLVTSETELLEVFTPDGRVDIGMSLAYYSAIQFLTANSALYVKRVHNGALYAAAGIKTATSSTENFTSPVGIADPDAYDFDGLPDAPPVAEVTDYTVPGSAAATFDVAGAGKAFTFFAGQDTAQYYVWYSVTGGVNTQTDPALTGTGVQVNILSSDTDEQVAIKTSAAIDALSDFSCPAPTTTTLTFTAAAAGVTTDASDVDTTGTITVTTQGADEVNQIDETLMIHGNSAGEYGSDVGIKIITDQAIVKEEGAFIIEVYKRSNTSTPVETWTVSREMGRFDGNNEALFVEDKLQGSNYINAKVNPAIDETIAVKAQASILWLGGGSDGAAVSDTEVVAGLDDFASTSEVTFNLLLDGGWATAAFAIAADTIANSRQDCVVINSTPFAKEASSDYMSELVDYRKTVMNLNSSYSTLYTPHTYITDKFNDRKIYIAPDGFVGAAIGTSAANFEVWFPPAGNTRGVVNALDVRRRFTAGQQDQLSDNEINYIRFEPGRGLRIFEQKTLLARASKLQELNVRLLLITIEPPMKSALEDFLFELNNASTRSRVERVLTSFLDNIKARQGISQFAVKVDEENNPASVVDQGQLIVDIYLTPVGAVREIRATAIITSEGVDLSFA